MDLGEFGAAIKELDPDAEKDTFTFFGEKFTVVAPMAPMLLFQMAAASTGKVDEAEGFAAIWETMRTCLDQPDLEPWTGEGDDPRPEPVKQFNQFYKIAVTKAADLPSLMKLAMKLFEAQNGRPTVEPQGSSDGPLRTSPSSSTSSTHPALAHLRPVSEVLAG